MIKLYEAEKFYVRPFIKEDITDEYLSWFSDTEVTKYTSHGLYGYTKEQAFEFFEKAEKAGDIIWAIVVKNTDPNQILCYGPGKYTSIPYYIHIGNIAFQNINWINRTTEFAGVIGNKDYWNKGIGTKAIGILFEHGFNKLNLNKIYLGTAVTNIGMKNIAIKLGMRPEGILIDHVFLEGQYTNIHQYGILKKEWNWPNGKDSEQNSKDQGR